MKKKNAYANTVANNKSYNFGEYSRENDYTNMDGNLAAQVANVTIDDSSSADESDDERLAIRNEIVKVEHQQPNIGHVQTSSLVTELVITDQLPYV